MLRRLSASDLVLVRAAITKHQGGKCAICGTPITLKTACQDHDHATGFLRGVLCRNCNHMEGKLKTIAIRGRRDLTMWDYLARVAQYWEYHSTPRVQYLYPTHLLPEEKRLKANAKARKKRAAKK